MSISSNGPSQREIALRFAEHGIEDPEGEAARIVEAAAASSARPPYVRQGGTLAFEMGLGQERQVVGLFKRVKVEGKRAWDEPELVTDSAGRPRVTLARRDAF
jgi:methylase of polypeptide subunit release factors